jgi:F-type H+-transporting ATPase subunit gamma
VKFLPIEPPKAKEGAALEYEFEPEPAQILEILIPRYIEVTFHRLLLESFSSEHAARMNAMRNATDNASELIDSLTLMYNKARQAGITRELLDIVGGAEALK